MKISRFVVYAAILTIFGLNSANAQGLGDLLNGGLGGALGNMIEGVFTSSDITVADMEGEWTSTGPAVAFQSEDFLSKAGGLAASGAIEEKLKPYYRQYGLNDAKLTITEDGRFTLKLKRSTLSGTITQSSKGKGVFDFAFTALGMKLLTVPAYVQKTSTTMDVMFDATKFKNLVSAVANLTGIKTAKAMASLLDQYKGLCVGFHLTGGSTKQTGSQGFNIGDLFNRKR